MTEVLTQHPMVELARALEDARRVSTAASADRRAYWEEQRNLPWYKRLIKSFNGPSKAEIHEGEANRYLAKLLDQATIEVSAWVAKQVELAIADSGLASTISAQRVRLIALEHRAAQLERSLCQAKEAKAALLQAADTCAVEWARVQIKPWGTKAAFATGSVMDSSAARAALEQSEYQLTELRGMLLMAQATSRVTGDAEVPVGLGRDLTFNTMFEVLSKVSVVSLEEAESICRGVVTSVTQVIRELAPAEAVAQLSVDTQSADLISNERPFRDEAVGRLPISLLAFTSAGLQVPAGVRWGQPLTLGG